MRGKRLWQTFRLYTILSCTKRTEYMRKKHVFATIGENTTIMDRIVPLYSKLIKLGSNVRIASGVKFITHDVVHAMLNDDPTLSGTKFQEKVGCIEINDNVFVGANSTILYGVRVGSNVIIGAGSLVNKDVPDHSVVAGVPARVIGTYEDFVQKRLSEVSFPDGLGPAGESISEGTVWWCWDEFYKNHPKTEA